MALKKSTFTRQGSLIANNAAVFSKSPTPPATKAAATALVLTFAELADAIIRGEVTHVTLGMPKDKKCLLLTANWDDSTATRVGGDSMTDLAVKAYDEFVDTATGGTEGEG